MPVVTRAQKRKGEPEPTKIQEPVPTKIQEPEPAKIQDFPLELIEKIAHHLDAKDVPKLMMLSKRLYSSYAADQSIVFGKHVAVVALGTVFLMKHWIKKFVDSPPRRLNATHPSFKRIESCDKLDFSFDTNSRPDVMLLKQLKFVNQLKLRAYRKEDSRKFLTNFCGSVKKNATLKIGKGSFEQDRAIKKQLSKFIENQLGECEKITLKCDFEGCYQIYHEAMTKTQIKMISIRSYNEFEEIVDWIVNEGIPSKNSEAVIHIVAAKPGDPAQFVGILSRMQGLQRVTGKKHTALVAHANKLLRENDEEDFSTLFHRKSWCFRRRIDPTTSCIYVSGAFYTTSSVAQVLAFYMSSQ